MVKNYSGNLSKFKKTRAPFKLKFKTKNAPVQQLTVPKNGTKIVFIDSAVRNLLKFNNSGQSIIEKLKHRRRQMQSKLARLRKHKKLQNHPKALQRLDEKISHIVRYASCLCTNFKNISLPN